MMRRVSLIVDEWRDLWWRYWNEEIIISGTRSRHLIVYSWVFIAGGFFMLIMLRITLALLGVS